MVNVEHTKDFPDDPLRVITVPDSSKFTSQNVHHTRCAPDHPELDDGEGEPLHVVGRVLTATCKINLDDPDSEEYSDDDGYLTPPGNFQDYTIEQMETHKQNLLTLLSSGDKDLVVQLSSRIAEFNANLDARREEESRLMSKVSKKQERKRA